VTVAEARALSRGADRFGVELDAATFGRLDRYLTVFELWRRRMRLTSERDLRRVIERHVIDSLAVVPELPPRGRLVDIGSGAGFPGIILGCVRPELDVVLVEARRKRVSFLREAIRATGLPTARALELRAEAAGDAPALAGSAAVVTGRAVRLETFAALAMPLLAADGRAVAMQTPATAAGADDVAARHTLRVVRRRDYALSDRLTRTLVVFARRNSTGQVS
jgi:16S rRNA (guanine527-N7)-methyltransferase